MMARQATDESRDGAEGWQAMAGPYAAAQGCEYQAIAFGILARCGAAPRPAERDAPARRLADRYKAGS